MKKEPLVSIIIPTYNRQNTILRAVESVLNQTYKNWELIIVDDGSTDNTKNILKSYLKNKKIRYFKTKNKGVCHARNFGMEKASGEYMGFLDSDDEFVRNKLEIQLRKMIKSNKIISISNYIKFNQNKMCRTDFEKDFVVLKKDIITNKISLSGGMIMLTKKITKKYLYDNNLPTRTDFDFILRILNKYKILFLNDFLVKIYKTLEGNRVSTNYKMKIKGSKEILKKIKEYKLSKVEKKLLLNKLYLDIGFFEILNQNFEKGRFYFKKISLLENFSLNLIKYRILSLLSYFPPLLNIIIKIGKFYWKI